MNTIRLLSAACVALGGASALSIDIDTAAFSALSTLESTPSAAKAAAVLRAGDLDAAYSASIFYQSNSSASNISYVGKMSQLPSAGQRMELLFGEGARRNIDGIELFLGERGQSSGFQFVNGTIWASLLFERPD